MKKTLGGDRLGSGHKMQVDLHGYERSTHDMGYVWRTTMSPGTLVPYLTEVALPGDTFDINIGCAMNTHPTIGPLFGSYKVQLDIFQCPIRLYQGQLHNNKLGIGMNMATVKLPVLQLEAQKINLLLKPDLDNAQINPSCILSYLGIRGVGTHNETSATQMREFNGIPLLAYWDIYKNYYANKQEEIGVVIHTDKPTNTAVVTSVTIDGTAINPASTGVPSYKQLVQGGTGVIAFTTQPNLGEIVLVTNRGRVFAIDLFTSIVTNATTATGTVRPDAIGVIVSNWDYANLTDSTVRPRLVTFPLDNIDQMRERILAAVQSPNAFNVTGQGLPPYNYVMSSAGNVTPMVNNQEGLAIKTYQSDMFNNWLSTEWIDGTNGIGEITAIDTSGGSFTIDTLNLSKKVYDMLNRIAVSGGTYDDWLDAVYTHDRYTKAETPMYMGGLIKELVFQEVVSNSAAAEENQPLGTLAGKGVFSGKHKGGSITIKVDEPSYIMGLISITPRIDYSQGNKWDVHLKTMDDFHKPALDEIGFQELITEQMAWWDTRYDGTKWVQKSAGKQPAWLNYMTNVNQVRGNFAVKDNEMFMTLNRRYETDDLTVGIKDLTTYIDPVKYNYIFAQTSLDAMNFWAQVSVDMTVRRKMSAKVMPNL
ncbi:MAG: major capsid protein [Microviridae sp.]|nr:MAG: major capsid protein [Microviridae sp.]